MWISIQFIHLRLNIRFLNNLVFMVFVWLLPLDLSGMGGPTSSYSTAGIALRVSGAFKHHHHDKVKTTSVGFECITYSRFYATPWYCCLFIKNSVRMAVVWVLGVTSRCTNCRL
jgi:hypothetical protein